ncbi:MAG: hypothetical protein R2837_05890 [Aliarcobacter sp.]
MEIIVLIVVIAILFLIGKNYKTEEFKNIKFEKKEIFQGDLMHHEAGLLVALMAKVSKADGKVCKVKAEVLRAIHLRHSNHFENQEEIREKLKVLYESKVLII